jgi:ribosomal protein S18 acetylase RimI-like enzyme
VEAISSLHRNWDRDRFDIKPNIQEMYAHWLPQRVTDQTSVFLVAERDAGRLVGYLVATTEEELPIYWVPECGYIHDIWVEQPYRHEGVGKQLVMEALARFKEMGVHQVRLETAAQNDAARQMFTSCGFRTATVEMMVVLGSS